jgi:hypothetical protein
VRGSSVTRQFGRKGILMSYFNRCLLAGTFLASAMLIGCQSRDAGSRQGWRREGPSPVARTSPPPPAPWNNQPQPTVAGNSVDTPNRLTNPQNTPGAATGLTANPQPMSSSGVYPGSTTNTIRSTATPTWPQSAPATGAGSTLTPASTWPSSVPATAPAPNSGSAPPPTWPATSMPTSRTTTPAADPSIPPPQ